MTNVEARVRCLEIAERLNGRHGNADAVGIVETSRILYAFTQEAEKPPLGLPKEPKKQSGNAG